MLVEHNILTCSKGIAASGKKRTPHGPADPDGSQIMSHSYIILYYNIKMCHF